MLTRYKIVKGLFYAVEYRGVLWIDHPPSIQFSLYAGKL